MAEKLLNVISTLRITPTDGSEGKVTEYAWNDAKRGDVTAIEAALSNVLTKLTDTAQAAAQGQPLPGFADASLGGPAHVEYDLTLTNADGSLFAKSSHAWPNVPRGGVEWMKGVLAGEIAPFQGGARTQKYAEQGTSNFGKAFRSFKL